MPPTDVRSSQANGHAAQVVLRPLGSALPLGFAGLAVASLVLSGLELGWMPLSESTHAGILLLVSGGALQAVTAVLAFLARDGAAGSALGLLSSTWSGIAIVHLTSAPGSTSKSLGLLLLAAGGLLLLGAAPVGMGKGVPALVIGLVGLRYLLSGIYELSANHTWQDVAGIVGLVVTGAAAYAVWALQLEDARDRPLLPLGRRGRGRESVTGSLDDQLRGLEHEPGVRQQL
jgi:succinate-acetate transporter protein